MTALVINSLNFSTSLFEKIWAGLTKTIQGIMVGWMISRQYHVNKVIATQLWNSGEYRKQDYSYYTLLAELNQK